MVRLNSNGTKDVSFNTEAGFSANAVIFSIVVQTDGKIIVGGQFNTFNGLPENAIIRLNSNGSKDSTFKWTSIYSQVTSIAMQPDGKMIISGMFVDPNSNSSGKKIMRLNADGLIDNTFILGTLLSKNDDYYDMFSAIAIQPDGKIIVGGEFSHHNGDLSLNIIRLNSNGSRDTTFNTAGGESNINSISLHTNGKISIGGSFTKYNNSANSAYLVTLYDDSILSNPKHPNQSNVSLWPNPTKNILNIGSFDNLFTAVKIYNLQGSQVYENLKPNTAINVSDLTNGLYFIEIKTVRGLYKEKFLKN